MKYIKNRSRLKTENRRLKQTLWFYADPYNYMAIGFFPDPPCGDFIDDFSETEISERPGKRARIALDIEGKI